ncbi:ATP-binding protein [Dactylosporangium sp. NPDC048998]|uniref:ATP-binding protein n=1 Tax=Dactylosporangium sp. NPDC048998 TaxID=3363976 RepID=UPI00371CF290
MISTAVRTALEELHLNPAPTPNDIWHASPHDVPELHERSVREILSGVGRARRSDTTQPLGVALQGRAGSGKTHLLGAVRDTIQRAEGGGYFFLVNMINGRTFWESTVQGIIGGLKRDAIGWGTQLKTFLRRLTAQLGIPADVRDAIAGDTPLTREHLDTFITALRRFDDAAGRECQDTARALVLYGSLDFDHQDIGQAHLISEPTEPSDRTEWGFTATARTPQEVVGDISRLIALTLSPSVIAIDQLDTLFAQSTTAFFDRAAGLEPDQAAVVGPVADGLLTLRDVTQRTLVVMSCLPDTWELLKRSAPGPVIERFRETVLPDRIDSAEIARAIVAKRLAAAYTAYHVSVDYDTWPIRPEAFDEARRFTPRALLRRVDEHLRRCLDNDEMVELRRFDEPAPPPKDTATGGDDLRPLDAIFAELVAAADVSGALDRHTEDIEMPQLLAAGISAWIGEQAPTGVVYKQDPQPGANPALHGRLIQVLDEATENEAHWGLRAIAHPNPRAATARIKNACVMAGLDRAVPQRRLVLLRKDDWPTGARTRETVEAFLAAGGIWHQIADADLRVFDALRRMQAVPHALFGEWLVSRRPASGTRLFREVFGPPGTPAEPPRPPKPQDPSPSTVTLRDPGRSAPISQDSSRSTVTPQDPSRADGDGRIIRLGRMIQDEAPFVVDLESLRRHTVIFAGSGSGKTVLIRRLVEECARQGVSAIVLDPNNDLARLGDPWPEPPSGWGPGDDERALDYLEHTDVVVWTPGVGGGRPLSFQPLPDFAPVRDSPDEFAQAVRAAVEALAPRAGVSGTTKLAVQGKAVLTEALEAYARGNKVGLEGFADFLADLPDDVSRMSRAGKLAHDLAETLKAAMVNDPLFGGKGASADPAVLLTPPPGKRARVSVISLIGLMSDEEKQGFVNQLQMALFTWLKRNPAGDRPLGGLFIMDEAQTLAPSTGTTSSTASTIMLASQARKYGLGLVFATQAPKGLHNQISGNATTQFFGLLNSPAQIDAARELAQAKGGKLPDIGLLGSGQFYAAGEGFSFVKVRTPLCLTHHPKAPLSPEEVLDRARR